MEGNDISADFVAHRYFVARRLVMTNIPRLRRVLWIFPTVYWEVRVDEKMLIKLNNLAFEGALLVLFGPDASASDLALLDEFGMHPFNDTYQIDYRELARELPYRRDIEGVLDFEHHALIWGRWATPLAILK